MTRFSLRCHHASGWLAHWGLLLLLALCFAGPLIVLALYTVGPGWRFPDLLPDTMDMRSLEFLWQQRAALATSLFASTLYSLAAVILSFVLCLLPAELLARREFWGKTMVEGFLLAPAMAPAMTFSMGAQTLFIIAGIDDSYFGVVLILTTFSYPYMLRALVTGFQSMGEGYGECAANLGAGLLTRLWRVELPLLVPAAVAGGTVVFLVAFSEYFLVFLIGGGTVASYTGYLFPYLTSSDRSLASALTLLFCVIPLGLMVSVELFAGRNYRRKGLW